MRPLLIAGLLALLVGLPPRAAASPGGRVEIGAPPEAPASSNRAAEPVGFDGEAEAVPDDWLSRHQSADGAWRERDLGSRCRDGRCLTGGGWEDDAGRTALALLAFVGYGETHRTPRYGRVVRRGFNFLKSAQSAEGFFTDRGYPRWLLNHARASLAMAEIFQMTQSPLWKDPARRGVGLLLELQEPDGGWRCDDASPASDIESTMWALMALRSAVQGGLREVDPGVFERALGFVDSVTDEGSGMALRTTLDPLPENPDRYTAMAAHSRVMAGSNPRRDRTFRRTVGVLATNPPRSPDGDHQADPVYTYVGALACYKAGGVPCFPSMGMEPGEWGVSAWRAWSNALKPAVLDHQNLDATGCRHGSWDPVPGTPDGESRIATTALRVLSIEVYYRYSRVLGSKGPEATPAVTPGDDPKSDFGPGSGEAVPETRDLAGPRRAAPPAAAPSAIGPSLHRRNRLAALRSAFPEPRTGFVP